MQIRQAATFCVGAKESVNGPQRWQSLSALGPALVEHLQGNFGILTYLAQEPLTDFGRQLAKSPLITTAFGLKGRKTSAFPRIPVIFQGACRRKAAIFVGHRTH